MQPIQPIHYPLAFVRAGECQRHRPRKSQAKAALRESRPCWPAATATRAKASAPAAPARPRSTGIRAIANRASPARSAPWRPDRSPDRRAAAAWALQASTWPDAASFFRQPPKRFRRMLGRPPRLRSRKTTWHYPCRARVRLQALAPALGPYRAKAGNRACSSCRSPCSPGFRAPDKARYAPDRSQRPAPSAPAPANSIA